MMNIVVPCTYNCDVESFESLGLPYLISVKVKDKKVFWLLSGFESDSFVSACISDYLSVFYL